MGTSVKTSKLLEYRATLGLVDERLEQIEAAYKKQDFDTFGQLTMAVRCVRCCRGLEEG